jgi:hypothetical protein
MSIPQELFMEQVYAVLDDSDAVEDYELQREAEDPIAFAATGSDPDTLHYNAAMKAHDAEDFNVAMIKEANDHTSRLHWALWEKQNLPADHKILSAIWAFKPKVSHQHASSAQAQGQDQRSWGTTNLWSQLLGDFLPSGQLVLYQAYSGPIIGLPMENKAD